jgi:hypothetical protein
MAAMGRALGAQRMGERARPDLLVFHWSFIVLIQSSKALSKVESREIPIRGAGDQ